MRTANPVLRNAPFRTGVFGGGETMTVQGTVNKTLIALSILVVAAGWTWGQTVAGANVFPWMIGGLIGGLAAGIATSLKPAWAPVTTPLYAAFEGLILGAISAVFNRAYPGIVVQAVGLTFGVLFVMLMAYTSGLIRATDSFRRGVVAATGGVFLFYFVAMVLGFFGVNMGFLWGSGVVGIGFSLVVVVIAALNLVLDFNVIEQGAAEGAPKAMEWYGAFALMVTLVWLYIEILRLLSKLRRR